MEWSEDFIYDKRSAMVESIKWARFCWASIPSVHRHFVGEWFVFVHFFCWIHSLFDMEWSLNFIYIFFSSNYIRNYAIVFTHLLTLNPCCSCFRCLLLVSVWIRFLFCTIPYLKALQTHKKITIWETERNLRSTDKKMTFNGWFQDISLTIT